MTMKVWRITIKTGAVEAVDLRTFRLQRNTLGVGWRVDKPAPTASEVVAPLSTDVARLPGAMVEKFADAFRLQFLQPLDTRVQ